MYEFKGIVEYYLPIPEYYLTKDLSGFIKWKKWQDYHYLKDNKRKEILGRNAKEIEELNKRLVELEAEIDCEVDAYAARVQEKLKF